MFASACGGDSGGNPGPGPSPTPTGVTVTSTGGTLFIGRTSQLQATETLSDGTTRPGVGLAWSSENGAIAAVSSSGVVTGLSAGQTNIFAGTNPRGQFLVRVFPSFAGDWLGTETIAACDATGDFRPVCREGGELEAGRSFRHEHTATQDNAEVQLTFTDGLGSYAMTGTISVGGELALGIGNAAPPDPDFAILVENWRSRSDSPSLTTGSYDQLLAVPGTIHTVRLHVTFQNVVRVGGGPSAAAASAAAGAPVRLIDVLRDRITGDRR